MLAKSLLALTLAVLCAGVAVAKPLERRAASNDQVAAAAANNSAVVLTVTGGDGSYTLASTGAGTSVQLQACSGNAVPASAVATGNDFVTFYLAPDVSAANTCYFYDSSAFNYAPAVDFAVSHPTSQSALVHDTSKTVSCVSDVPQTALAVCYDLTATKFAFAAYQSNQMLAGSAGSASEKQYSSSSDLADAINSGGPLPAGEDYPEVPPYLNTNQSAYSVVIFNSTDNYTIGTDGELVFSVPFDLGAAYFTFAVELWVALGSQTGQDVRMLLSLANVTTADALNGTTSSWSVPVDTNAANISAIADSNATQTNYFIAVYGRRSVNGPNNVPALPWDPVYYGLYYSVFA